MMRGTDIRSLIFWALLLTLPVQVAGSEFRQFKPIAVAPNKSAPAAVSPVATTQPAMQPLSRGQVQQSMQKLLAAWNAKQLDGVLGSEFYDRSQLNDAMNTKVPRDAEISLLAIQGVRTIDQKTVDSPSGKLLVSTVSITASTQLTYNDPTNGYQRREGVNEYIVRIKQKEQEGL